MLAEPLRNLFAHRSDGFLLVIPVSDFVINGNAHQIHPLGAPVHQLLQVILAENATDLPLRGGLVIPEVGFKAIGGEHHGAAAKFPFQTIRIQNRLFASNVWVLAGALGFHHRQGQAVLSKQHIVAEARLTWHPGHILHTILLLYISIWAGELPAHQFEVHVDVDFAGLEFREVLRLEGAFLLMLLLFGGVSGGHLLDLLAQRLDLGIFLVQQTFLFLDFPGVHRHLSGGDKILVEGALLIVRAIAIVDPLHKLKQTAQRSKRITWLNAALGMYRQIAQLDDKRHLAPSVGVHSEAESWLMNEGLQIVFVGHFHGLVRCIYPFYCQLQCLTAAYCTHGRSRNINFLSFHAGGGEEGIFSFGFEKGEVSHHIISSILFLLNSSCPHIVSTRFPYLYEVVGKPVHHLLFRHLLKNGSMSIVGVGFLRIPLHS